MGNRHSKRLTNKDVDALRQNQKRGTEMVGKKANSQLVKQQFVDALLYRDVKRARRFCTDDAVFVFDDSDFGVTMSFLLDLMQNLSVSFPDYCCTFDEIREIEPGKVIVHNFRSKGSHTGKAFTCGDYPEVPTTGLCVEDVPYDFIVHMSKGKLTKMVAYTKGNFVGPLAFYIGIGGEMPLHKPSRYVRQVTF